MDDCCRLVLPYNSVHSIQQTEQIPNDPPRMAAKNTTTSNHPSSPVVNQRGSKIENFFITFITVNYHVLDCSHSGARCIFEFLTIFWYAESEKRCCQAQCFVYPCKKCNSKCPTKSNEQLNFHWFTTSVCVLYGFQVIWGQYTYFLCFC